MDERVYKQDTMVLEKLSSKFRLHPHVKTCIYGHGFFYKVMGKIIIPKRLLNQEHIKCNEVKANGCELELLEIK